MPSPSIDKRISLVSLAAYGVRVRACMRCVFDFWRKTFCAIVKRRMILLIFALIQIDIMLLLHTDYVRYKRMHARTATPPHTSN